MHNERVHNLSAVLQQKHLKLAGKNKDNKDDSNNLAYIRQIEGLAQKRKGRYYLKRQKQWSQDAQPIGGVTGHGTE